MRIRTSLPRLQAQGKGRFWNIRPVGALYIGLVLAVRIGFSEWDLLRSDPDLNMIRDTSAYERLIPGT